MKFAVITALCLASGAAGRPTDPNQDPAYVPAPNDGSYSAPRTMVQGYADDTKKMERELKMLKSAALFVDPPETF
ncbi:hypothetical protein EG328_010259 [Venturia inaequalis]|uniref:Uncharacterized protein n=1 Tax=Venturia inaequalis TaxID=5025 RepID=A0A8H3VJ96_VENIN|nr:hypothetical protein EG328_010259 [Venturia inaequalis]KAE9989855.1 hypothetical protein EG327_002196 [Venturia inaequalis]